MIKNLIAASIVLAGCTRTVDHIAFNIDNPARVGEEKYLVLVNGIQVGECSIPDSTTTTVVNYYFRMKMIGKIGGDQWTQPNRYIPKRGAMDNVYLQKDGFVGEVDCDILWHPTISFPTTPEEIIIFVESPAENTGRRSYHLTGDSLLMFLETGRLHIPSIKSLPVLTVEELELHDHT